MAVSPGPWRTESTLITINIVDRDGTPVVFGDEDWPSEDNAALIAASPELRDALAWALGLLKYEGPFVGDSYPSIENMERYQAAKLLLERIKERASP